MEEDHAAPDKFLPVFGYHDNAEVASLSGNSVLFLSSISFGSASQGLRLQRAYHSDPGKSQYFYQNSQILCRVFFFQRLVTLFFSNITLSL